MKIKKVLIGFCALSLLLFVFGKASEAWEGKTFQGTIVDGVQLQWFEAGAAFRIGIKLDSEPNKIFYIFFQDLEKYGISGSLKEAWGSACKQFPGKKVSLEGIKNDTLSTKDVEEYDAKDMKILK